MNQQASTSSHDDNDFTRRNIAEFEEIASKVSKRSEGSDDTEQSESAVIRSIAPLLTQNLTDPERKNVLGVWLNVLGLCPVNIRHLELCSITDVQSLVKTPQRELRSLCDRGRFPSDVKQRLLKSTALLLKYIEALKAGTEASIQDQELSWSFGSPSVEKRNALEERKSSSMSPPSERFSSLRRRQGATSVDLDEKTSKQSLSISSLTPKSESASPTAQDNASTRCGSLSLLSTSSSTLSPPSPLSTSTQSTPSLGSGNKVIMSTSMQFISPKSPKTSRLVHTIPHKWHRSTKFRFSSDAVCQFCQRPLGFGFLNAWEKCRSCKLKVHTQCKNRVADTCGLTPDHLRFLFDKLIEENNGGMWNDPQSAVPMACSRSMNEPAFQYPDTAIDSSSSTNSSAPSTPALPLGLASSPFNPHTAPYRSDRKFLFPDAAQEFPSKLPILVISQGDLNIKEEGQCKAIGDGSEGTIIAEVPGNNESGDNSKEPQEPQQPAHNWDRNTWNMSTIRGPNTQSSWNEVAIHIDNIELHGVIGRGRFGEVRRGFHFGDVIIKMLSMEHVAEEKRMDEFKAEVSAHKNTRHDNIALFLGFCYGKGAFGIVQSPCKGRSIHQILHRDKETIDLPSVLTISQQICTGISYLHTKKIVHRDLRSKNVYVDQNKAVISDFAIVSMKRLRAPPREYGILLPTHWLSYTAPEVLKQISETCDHLSFTEQSDVFAFGSIWYEMLTCRIPFGDEPWQKLVWMVGNGIKAPIQNLNCSRDMKDVLMRCWSYRPEDRPSFFDIQSLLVALPKKRLDRSPSYPTIRSFESAF